MVTYFNRKDLLEFFKFANSEERKKSIIDFCEHQKKLGYNPLRPEQIINNPGHATIENFLEYKRSGDFIEFTKKSAHKKWAESISIGDEVFRKSSNAEEGEWHDGMMWRRTRVNETYLPLIKEFPENYRPILPD